MPPQNRVITNLTDQLCDTLLEREIAERQDALPVRLAPWIENPYRLVSLCDIVIPFSADKFFWSGYALENLKTDCVLKPGTGDRAFSFMVHMLEESTREKALDWLEHVQAEGSRAGCRVAAPTS